MSPNDKQTSSKIIFGDWQPSPWGWSRVPISRHEEMIFCEIEESFTDIISWRACFGASIHMSKLKFTSIQEAKSNADAFILASGHLIASSKTKIML